MADLAPRFLEVVSTLTGSGTSGSGAGQRSTKWAAKSLVRPSCTTSSRHPEKCVCAGHIRSPESLTSV